MPDIDQKKVTKSKKSIIDYAMQKNPKTGCRYSIPGLSIHDPDYYTKYAGFMRTREFQPDLFEKILRWD